MFNHLNEHYQKEFNKIRAESIQVLHWRQFDTKRKRQTIIMKYINNKERNMNGNREAPMVYIFSKGNPDSVFNVCDSIFHHGAAIDEATKVRELTEADRQ